MPRRVESPSSINTYKQCPRRYFYQYIRRFPTFPNIHTVRGNIVHSALEKFFELDPASVDPLKYRPELAAYLSNLFEALWRKGRNALEKVTSSNEQERVFYEESRMMLGNWLNSFFEKIKQKMKNKSFIEAFNELKPIALEAEYQSDAHHVKGFIDVIENEDGIIKLVDYKTG
ncbi:MAG: PD-(D/E)XK nuclease family protein, partial [Nanoarchaeota archaeon]|nr:PD-(D/E)XK nuclease family protein [Nanoarchaeota archaeon]